MVSNPKLASVIPSPQLHPGTVYTSITRSSPTTNANTTPLRNTPKRGQEAPRHNPMNQQTCPRHRSLNPDRYQREQVTHPPAAWLTSSTSSPEDPMSQYMRRRDIAKNTTGLCHMPAKANTSEHHSPTSRYLSHRQIFGCSTTHIMTPSSSEPTLARIQYTSQGTM